MHKMADSENHLLPFFYSITLFFRANVFCLRNNFLSNSIKKHPYYVLYSFTHTSDIFSFLRTLSIRYVI